MELSGLKIIDLSTDICGPYHSKLFADAGAEVIRIESADKDNTRADSLRGQALFDFLNASKKSCILELATEQGRQDFLELVKTADMVVEDFPGSGLEELGLSPDILRKQNSKLVVVSISAWGRQGPFSKYPANEFTLQSWVGSIAYRGIPEQQPFGVGGQLGDYMTAASAAAASMASVLVAQKTGQGIHLDISKYEAMTTSFVTHHHILETFDPGGTRASGRVIEIPSIEPTSDGWVGFCAITGQQFQDFCVLIGDDEMSSDERFSNFDNRMENRDEAWEKIANYTLKHKTQEIVEKATQLRIPVAPIGNGENVLENEHFGERGIFVRNPKGFMQPRVPFQMEKTEFQEFLSAPELGEHTKEIKNQAAKGKTKNSSSKGHTKNHPYLKGIRVCDLSAFWAGPMATSFLAALGAEVIKVESPKRPDGMRFAGSPPKEKMWEWSPVFHGSNVNKSAITLDISTEQGMGLLKKLISKSDVVVENFSPRVMENWGLTWEVIKEINPNAIMLRMPAFGLDGPWKERTGFAMTIEQASGLAFRTGDSNGRPMVPRGVCDPLGAMHSVFALLLALKHRQETGEAQLVEVPLIEVGLNVAAEQVVEWSANKNLLTRIGNRSLRIAPQGIYPCMGSDSWVCISMDCDAHWTGFTKLIGADELESLDSLEKRQNAHNQIDDAISAWTKTQERDVAVDAISSLGIPAAPVITGRESINNSQLAARGFHQWLEHPVAGKVPYPSFPIKFGDKYLEIKTPAPTLGQHNEEVLRNILDMSQAEISQLEAEGVIGTEPNF